MLHTTDFRPAVRPAVVSKAHASDTQYLRLDPNGSALWVADPARATAFDSMREATRMAMRLPAAERAFGLPLEVELDTYDYARLH
jgi:hypothetical protein